MVILTYQDYFSNLRHCCWIILSRPESPTNLNDASNNLRVNFSFNFTVSSWWPSTDLVMPFPNWGHLKNIFIASEKSDVPIFPGCRYWPDCVGIVSLRVKVRVIRGQLDIGLINWNPLNLIPSSVCGLRKVIIYSHLKWIHNLKDDLKWDLRNNSRHVGGVSADVWGEAEYFLVLAPGTNQISHWPRTIPILDPE